VRGCGGGASGPGGRIRRKGTAFPLGDGAEPEEIGADRRKRIAFPLGDWAEPDVAEISQGPRGV
jgi:hypothetical protein